MRRSSARITTNTTEIGKFSDLLWLGRLASAFMLRLPPPRTGSLLDDGCGSGDFLLRAMGLGWNALGAEFDQSAIETCIQRGARAVEVDAVKGEFAPGNQEA